MRKTIYCVSMKSRGLKELIFALVEAPAYSVHRVAGYERTIAWNEYDFARCCIST